VSAAPNSEALQALRAQFIGSSAEGESVLRTLEKDGFVITRLTRATKTTWLVSVKPPEHIQESFGLAPEVQITVVQGEVQARDLQRAANEVLRSGLRLDGNLVVVVDCGSSPLQERLERIPGRDQRVAWVKRGETRPLLSAVLRERLPTYDVFEERDPVRGSQLMGRDVEVAQLRTRVLRGDAVGVFGLRKMGKTSLVRAVTDALDPASGMKAADDETADSPACVVWMDAQSILDASVDSVATEMLSALGRRMRVAHATYRPPSSGGLSGLKNAVEALLDSGSRLCFVMDEYDYLFESDERRAAIPGLSRLLRLLRGWAQQWQGSVALVLIGRDPEHLSTPTLDGVTNPLLAWSTPLWLGPLRPPRDGELLRRLGRRTGMDVGPRTIEVARKWSGGHPLLHRQFGSALRAELRRHDLAWGASTEPYGQRVVEVFRNLDAVTTVDREIVDLLKKRYSAGYGLLLDTVHGGDAEFVLARSGGAEGPGARALRNFGLFDPDSGSIPEHLCWYVRTFLPVEPRAAS